MSGLPGNSDGRDGLSRYRDGRRDGPLARILRGWREIGAGLGTFLGLVALSALLGAAIAIPLWLFATSHREAYTIAVGAAAGAGIVFLVVRRAARPRGRAGGPPAGGARSALGGLASALLAVLKLVLLVASLGAAASTAIAGRWLAFVPAAAVLLAVAAWIGLGAGSRKSR